METIKIQDAKNPKVVKEVKKSLAGDYIGTGRFKIYEEPKKEEKPSFNINTKNKQQDEEK